MDNALRCPQPHSFSRRIVQLIELKDREERCRLSWIVAYRERPDAGAVCRRFGISRPTLRKWLRRYEAEGEVGLRALSRRPHHFPARKVDERCKRRSLICVEPGGLARSGCVTNCIGCMACGFPRRRFTKCSCSTDSVFCRHANAHVTSRNATTGRCQVIACRWIRARSDPVYTNSPPSMIAAGSLSPA